MDEVAPRVTMRGGAVRRGRTLVLRECSFDLQPGITGVIGRNGAGKTSLLRTLATVVPPSAGTLTIDGHGVDTLAGLRAARRSLGYVPQEWALPGSARVVDAVRHGAWLHRLDRPGPTVERVLDELDLAGVRRARLATLSTGTRRRVSLALALVHEPSVVLLDEPTAGLDPPQRARLWSLIEQRCERSAVLVSTHDLSEVHARADSVLLLAGRSVVPGPVLDPTELAAALEEDR